MNQLIPSFDTADIFVETLSPSADGDADKEIGSTGNRVYGPSKLFQDYGLCHLGGVSGVLSCYAYTFMMKPHLAEFQTDVCFDLSGSTAHNPISCCSLAPSDSARIHEHVRIPLRVMCAGPDPMSGHEGRPVSSSRSRFWVCSQTKTTMPRSVSPPHTLLCALFLTVV